MKTEQLVIGGGLLALGWWLYNQKQTTSRTVGIGNTVLPSRQTAPNVGALAPGLGSSLLPGSSLYSGDFGYLPNVGPVNADLIAAALDANTITDLPTSIVNPAIDPWVLENLGRDINGNPYTEGPEGDVLPSITIVDPGWGGLV